MCGIYFCYGRQPDCPRFKQFETKCRHMITRRGPDVVNFRELDGVGILSSVLWLQGSSVFPQPVNNDHHCFLWNGDIYLYDNTRWDSRLSDTEFIYSKLRDCETDCDIIRTLERIKGPWAFVFWDKARDCLWYGRDFFGRQSLLMSRTESCLVLTSCAPRNDLLSFSEVPANGIYKLNLAETVEPPLLFPWDCLQTEPSGVVMAAQTIACPVKLICDVKPQSIEVESNEDPEAMFDSLLMNQAVSNLVDRLIDILTEAVKTRIENQPGRCKNCVKCCRKVLTVPIPVLEFCSLVALTPPF